MVFSGIRRRIGAEKSGFEKSILEYILGTDLRSSSDGLSRNSIELLGLSPIYSQ